MLLLRKRKNVAKKERTCNFSDIIHDSFEELKIMHFLAIAPQMLLIKIQRVKFHFRQITCKLATKELRLCESDLGMLYISTTTQLLYSPIICPNMLIASFHNFSSLNHFGICLGKIQFLLTHKVDTENTTFEPSSLTTPKTPHCLLHMQVGFISW